MRRYFIIIYSTIVLTIFIVGSIFATGTGNPAALFPLCLFLATLLPIPFVSSPYFTYRRRHRWRFLMWLVPLLLLTGFLLYITDGDVIDTLVCLSPIPLVVFLILVFRSNRHVRRRRGMVVIAYLEQAMRMNLPLPRMLAAAQASETGPIAARLRAVRQKIESGSTLTQALNFSLQELPLRAVGLIGAAERIGQVPQTLDRLIREDRASNANSAVERTFMSVYPVVMSLAIFIIVSIIMVFVIPKFEQIFRDFRVDLPPITILLISTARFVSDNVLLLAFLAVLFAIGVTIPDQYRPSIHGLRFGLDRFGQHRDLADATRIIADTLAAGLPLDAALRHAGELPINSRLRWKLYRWAGGIEQGMPTAEAARRASMPNIIVGLSAAADITAAGETFRFLSRYYAAKFSRLVQLARGAAVPAMVFFFAIIVVTVELGLFMPMIALIKAVSPLGNHL